MTQTLTLEDPQTLSKTIIQIACVLIIKISLELMWAINTFAYLATMNIKKKKPPQNHLTISSQVMLPDSPAEQRQRRGRGDVTGPSQRHPIS